MSDLVERLTKIANELSAAPAITIRERMIEPSVAPVDKACEEDLREDCETFELDDAIRAVWSEIERVRIEWWTDEHGSGPGGIICLPSLFDLVQPAFDEDEVALLSDNVPVRSDGGPYPARDEADRRFLLDLHFIELREAGHWTAFRARKGKPLEIWYRRSGSTEDIDLKLRADFGTYLEMLLLARGCDSWPLLLADFDAVAKPVRSYIAKYLVPQLESALEVLAKIDGARVDAQTLLDGVSDLKKELRRSPSGGSRGGRSSRR